MFSLNVLGQATKRTWNSDMCAIQIQVISIKQDQIVQIISVKQYQIVKEEFITDKIKYVLHDKH